MRTRPPTVSLLDIHDAGSCVTTTSTTSCGSSSSSGLGGTGSDVSSSSCDYQTLPPPPPPLPPHLHLPTSRPDTVHCPPRLIRPYPAMTSASPAASSSSSSSSSNQRIVNSNYCTYQNIASLYSNYAVPSQLVQYNSNYFNQPSPIHCMTLELEKDEKGELGIFITGRRTADGTLGYVVAGLETGSPAHRLVTLFRLSRNKQVSHWVTSTTCLHVHSHFRQSDQFGLIQISSLSPFFSQMSSPNNQCVLIHQESRSLQKGGKNYFLLISLAETSEGKYSISATQGDSGYCRRADLYRVCAATTTTSAYDLWLELQLNGKLESIPRFIGYSLIIIR